MELPIHGIAESHLVTRRSDMRGARNPRDRQNPSGSDAEQTPGFDLEELDQTARGASPEKDPSDLRVAPRLEEESGQRLDVTA